MRLLITRPKQDAVPLAKELEAFGHDCVVEPLLTIVFSEPPLLDLDKMKAVLLTSANGARALAGVTARQDLLVLAVGEATANAAREAGFRNIGTAGGDVDALVQLVQIMVPAGTGPLLHLAGSVTRGELVKRLRDLGYDARREVLYRAEPVEALSSGVQQDLRAGRIGGVVLFSPRTADHFVRLLAKHHLAEAVRGVQAFCLSQAVADKLAGLAFQACHVASSPRQDALVELIGIKSKA